jgi:hypothetical protein
LFSKCVNNAVQCSTSLVFRMNPTHTQGSKILKNTLKSSLTTWETLVHTICPRGRRE